MHEETRINSTLWTELDNTSANTVNPPLYRGSTVLFKNYTEMCDVDRHQFSGITYGTDRLPTQRQFEEAMRRLEGAALTRICPSGIDAIRTALMTFLKAGDHLLVCDNAYMTGQHFCSTVLKKFGVETTAAPANVAGDIEKYIRPNTAAILLESPGSITMELQDIPAVCAVARKHDIVTLIDNTWATPFYLNPFTLGVDITIHSLTKYICGYSDVLAGSVSANAEHAETLDDFYKTMEIYAPAEDCALALRGLHTLEVRLSRHAESALQIARWLETHPLVENVLHPALESHPEHRLWKRDFTGSTGLFAFTLKSEYKEEDLATFIDHLQLFHLGYSWGGYKSLLTAAKVNRQTNSRYTGKTIIRLSIGLENVDDLQQDLEAGLAQLQNM
ncbi:cystathionine beta-lyase [Desulforhopalus vacuolatus]|uniref:cystathionine beta-lyase n=1 Tax=Desulforhopalus vacuolatus TaxID=40414 RepID=UPI0019650F45|nr:cystathionine beta-lyase [Desulforhopalus vacuolatus]MBM9519497.1 cystathionine beta-lyase [Desulforhopalus vacuolatus]